MWILFAFASAFFAGLTSILAKIGIKDIDSHLATALRTIVITIFAWLMVFIVGSQSAIHTVSQKTLIFLILSGMATGGSWLCYFKALQIGEVNKVVPIDKSSTVLTMILAIIFLGESFSLLKLLSITLIASGTYMMIENKKPEDHKPSDNSWLIYALGAAFFASMTAILGKIGIEGIESNLGTAIRTIVVLIMAWGIVFTQGTHRQVKNISKKNWQFLTLSGIATGMSWMCYYRALQEGPASVVVPIDKLSILLTVFFAYIVFGEKLSKRSALGLSLVVTGTLLLLV